MTEPSAPPDPAAPSREWVIAQAARRGVDLVDLLERWAHLSPWAADAIAAIVQGDAGAGQPLADDRVAFHHEPRVRRHIAAPHAHYGTGVMRVSSEAFPAVAQALVRAGVTVVSLSYQNDAERPLAPETTIVSIAAPPAHARAHVQREDARTGRGVPLERREAHRSARESDALAEAIGLTWPVRAMRALAALSETDRERAIDELERTQPGDGPALEESKNQPRPRTTENNRDDDSDRHRPGDATGAARQQRQPQQRRRTHEGRRPD